MRVFTQSEKAWDELLLHLVPHPPFLQTATWARIKQEQVGWRPRFLVWHRRGGPRAAALVLTRRVGPGLRVGYTPHGPVVPEDGPDEWSEVLHDLAAWARDQGLLYLKMDAPVPVAFGEPGSEEERLHPPGQALAKWLHANRWRPSTEWVQFPNTIWVDLAPPEDRILARMKQKTRYNIRLAGRKGVTVDRLPPEQFPLLYDMYAATARRDGFPIRPRAYYLHLWHTLHRAGMLTPFLARVEGEPVAGLVLVHFGPTAWYLHGMSLSRHRNKMPNHALQWAAMQWAKTHGCTRYDMWGAPTHFSPQDPMWGVYRFKKGFGGVVVRTLGPWDWTPHPWGYRLYQATRPRALALWRWLASRRPALPAPFPGKPREA